MHDQRPVRIGVVGLGLIGRRHAAILAQGGVARLVAVADPSASARAVAEGLGVPCLPDIEALLERDIDGVILASPTPLHAQQARVAVAAGVPALIEKPIASDGAEAAALVAMAEAAGVPLLVGHHRRHNPLVRAAKEAIDAGRLGRVCTAQATCWFHKPAGYFDEAPWRKAVGAGPISVNLAHDIDLMRHLVGEITRVQATAAPSSRGYANEEVAAAVLTHDGGAISTIAVSDIAVSPWSWEMTSAENPAYPATPESCYRIAGTDGALSVPDLRLWTHEGAPDWWSPIRATSLRRAQADPLTAQIAHFAQVIRGEAVPLVSGRDGLRTLEVIEAMQRAARTGRAETPGRSD